MNATKLVIVAAAVGLFLAACGQATNTSKAPANAAPAASPSNPLATSPKATDADAGAQLYAENCQICHKDTGKGGKNLTIDGKKISPADLTSDKANKHTDAMLIKDITEGATDDGMPAFKDKLTPEQMKQIVLHIRKLQGHPDATPAPVAL